MKKFTILFFALALCLSACKKGPEYGDAVYITGTLTSSTVRFSVDGESSMGITVSSSAKAESDITINLALATEMIDSYNASTGRNCQLPPSESYSLEGNTVTIEAGQVQSTQLKLDVDSEPLSEGVSYCIPVTITSVDGGGLSVLESSRTAYILLTKVITIKVASLNRAGSFDIESFKDSDDNPSPVRALDAMTLEMKVYPVSFPNTPNSANGISSLCGCEENFLFRFGDGAGNATNRLQLAKASIGTATHPDSKNHYDAWITEFDTGHWVHFAATYDGSYLRIYIDGEQVHSVETTGGTINLSTAYNGTDWSDTFSIGRSAGNARYFDGYVSECRVWNVARTSTELQDGICYVDPTSDGLIAYWRFNGEVQDDGSVLDETGHGYNAIPHGNITYVDGMKCPY